MEEEVRDHEIQQVGLAGEARLRGAELEGDGARFAAVDLLRLEGLEEGHRLGDPLVQFGEGGFGVGEAGDLDPGEARRAALDAVGGDLDLARQRVHVGGQAGVDEHRGVDLAGLGVGLGLGEDRRQIAQHPREHRDGGLVHR